MVRAVVSICRGWAALLAAGGCAVLLCAGPAAGANRDALRQIVQDQCLRHWREQHSAAPCEELRVEDAPRGYAVLADRKGGAHFLLIPTRSISGIESPALLEPGAENYFWEAWKERVRLAAVVGHPIADSLVGLAVNPPHARSQDQLHIHIECLRRDVLRALERDSARITAAWMSIAIGRAEYYVRKVPQDLEHRDPFKLLAEHMPGSGGTLADYTLIVACPGKGPGFLMLASTQSAGELLLDSTCAAAAAA